MDTLYDSLVRAQQHLRAAGIESAAIGALAVNVWGRPRATLDVDLKVALDRDQASILLDLLPPDYEPIGDDPRGFLEQLGFVFVRDRSGNRIDFLLADMGFDEEAIRRSLDVEVRSGLVARVCTAEDLIIYKLISTRPRDYEDARTIVARQAGRLDLPYMARWLREFETALGDSTLLCALEDLLRRATRS